LQFRKTQASLQKAKILLEPCQERIVCKRDAHSYNATVKKIVFFGTFDPAYPRNRGRIAALRLQKHDVHVCALPFLNMNMYGGNAVKRPHTFLGFFLKAAIAYPLLLWKLLWKLKGTEELHVGTMGHMDAIAVWPFAKLSGIPLVFDPLVSLYDTAVLDRKLLRPGALRAKLLWGLDWLAFRAADRLLIDTHAHLDYLVKEFSLPRAKFSVVPLKADASFKPMHVLRPPEDQGRFILLFHGKFIPLHGIEKVLKALSIIERSGENRITLRIAGIGQTYPEMRRLAEELHLQNIEWLGWLPHERMPLLINQADLCLGAFGDSDKAKRVVPNKVWEALACGKRVLSQIMPAPEHDPLLKNVRWVESSPEAIAGAILDEFRLAGMREERPKITAQREKIQA